MARSTQIPNMITQSTIIYETVSPGAAGINMYICDIFGYHNWLQSDAAFFYPRLDQYSLSVGMFCSTCGLSRRPPGRLATASSLAGNAS